MGSVWDPDLVAPEDVPILESLRDLLTKARTHITELEAELEAKHRDEELNDRRAATAADRMASLESEIRLARGERKDVEARLRKAEAALRDRDATAETLRRDFEALKSDRARLREQLKELDSGRARLRKRIEDLEQEHEDVGDIRRQRADLTARVIELEAQIEGGGRSASSIFATPGGALKS